MTWRRGSFAERSAQWLAATKVRAGNRHVSELPRYIVRAAQVLREGGPKALLGLVKSRIFAAVDSHPGSAACYQREGSLAPIEFRCAEVPTVSIIVPASGKELATFGCLKSILDKTEAISYEVIVAGDCSKAEIATIFEYVKNAAVVCAPGDLHHARSCNSAAAQARGSHLVFLNNDTLVTGGWLRSLRSAFDWEKDVGLVGSKVIYPDSKLQEAGRVITHDGLGQSCGRLRDANEPEFNYLKEVDCCSPVCVMIDKAFFNDIGMFDEGYESAEYANMDLALRIRKAGRKVLYQPRSVIVHFGANTSGRRQAASDREKDRELLCRRWGESLGGPGFSGALAGASRGDDRKSRILAIEARMLAPDQDSGSYRMVELLKVLRELDYKVTFAAANLEYREPYVGDLQERGIEVLYRPYVASIEEYLRIKGKQFGTIVLCRVDLAKWLIDTVRRYAPETRVIFDTVDLHFLREERLARVKNSPSLMALAGKRKNTELETAAKADVVIVVSSVEKEILREVDGDLRIEIVSNIHDLHGCERPFHERNHVMFLGGFEHFPNVDAVKFFVTSILPIIQLKLPGIRTYIVGNKPPDDIKALESLNVCITGYVEDLSFYFNECRVFVAPLRFGAGVKGKMNMSMSYGLPIVGTSVAVEGTYLEDEEDVLIADDPQPFAEKVVKLYQDEKLWNKLSRNSMRKLETHFSRAVAKRTLKGILERL